ncbi:hypothetical protein GUJ93_ZPchr0014g47571 [Zizania palustris]|uniref:Uncharacterized protein n=1 Tax=Zizania palustris TaxID=103762 RepID=A0A8J5SWM4_ZIZPA|nr:hypothetical protein GUJ93_ZPchr0014g47571 [Zizania palustris]
MEGEGGSEEANNHKRREEVAHWWTKSWKGIDERNMKPIAATVAEESEMGEGGEVTLGDIIGEVELSPLLPSPSSLSPSLVAIVSPRLETEGKVRVVGDLQRKEEVKLILAKWKDVFTKWLGHRV